jgi:hypothetical protein
MRCRVVGSDVTSESVDSRASPLNIHFTDKANSVYESKLVRTSRVEEQCIKNFPVVNMFALKWILTLHQRMTEICCRYCVMWIKNKFDS